MFGYTRQAYYKSLRNNDKSIVDDCSIIIHVKQIRVLVPRIGTKKLQFILRKHGVIVSRDHLFGLLRENGMLVRRRKKYTVTTNSKHWMRKYRNLIRGFHFTAINQLWVSDMTYIPIDGSYAYLSLVTDAYSHKIWEAVYHRAWRRMAR